ncbi:MAG: proline-rich domain-containing protein, partial [Sarcina sp.]
EVANGTLNAANGENHVVYNVTQDVQNTVKVQVQNPDGTIVPITSDNVGNYEGGSNLTPQTSKLGLPGDKAVTENGTALTTPVAPKGYHIVKVTSQVGTETPTTESDNYKVPGTLGTTSSNTTYTIAPNSASLDVSVNLVNSKGGVISQLEKPTTTIPSTKGYFNEKIGTNGEPTTSIVNDINSGKYKVTSVTVNGKQMSLNDYKTEVADGTLNAANGENHVVYNVVPVDKVTYTIETNDGSKIFNDNTPINNPETSDGTFSPNTNVTGTIVIPKGYKIVSTTSNIGTPAITTKDGVTTLHTKTSDSETTPETTHVTIKVVKMASLDVSVNLVNGKGDVISQLQKPTITIPSTEGYFNEKIGDNGSPETSIQSEINSGKYTITSVTINGKTISLKDYQNEIANGTLDAADGLNHIIYNVREKGSSVAIKVQNTVKVQVQNPDGTIIPITSDNAGNYEGGSNLAPQTSKLGTDGEKAVTENGTALATPVAPKGYHIVKVTNQVGKEAATTESDSYKVPGTLGTANNSTTYTIAPNSASLDVTVNLVNSKGEVVSQLEAPTTTIPNTKGYFNEKIGTNGEPSQTVQDAISNGKYTVTSVTVNGQEMSLNNYKTEVADGTLNATNGENHIVYNVSDVAPKTYKTTIIVTTPDGKEIPQIQPKTVVTPAGGTVTGTGITVPKGYKIVKVTVDNNNVTPTATTGNSNIPAITNTESDHTVHYVVEKIPTQETGKVTVVVETKDGTIMVPMTEHEGDVNTPISAGDTAYTNVPGYHVVGLTVNGNPVSPTSTGAYQVPAMKYNDGTQNVVWIIAKDAPTPVVPPVKPEVSTGKVNVKVVNDTTGQTIVQNHLVDQGNVGDKATGTSYTPPSGTHITKVTVNGQVVPLSSIPNIIIQDGDTNIVYHIADNPKPVENGKVSVTVQTEGGEILVPTVTNSGVTGTQVSAGDVAYTPVKGYHLVGVQVNGQEVPASEIPTLKFPDNSTTKVVWIVAKDAPTPVKPEAQKSSVSVTYQTTTGKILVPTTTQDGDVGSTINSGLSFNPIKGYHLVKTVVNGDDKGTESINSVTLGKDATHIVYILEPDAPTPTPEPTPEPTVKTGSVTVKVVTSTGQVITPQHQVCQGNVGDNVTGDSITVPNGYHISKITVNGVPVKSLSGMTIVDGTTHIVYTISKDETKPPVKDGSVSITVISSNGKILVPTTTINGPIGEAVPTGYEPIPGYHLTGVTVNGSSVTTTMIPHYVINDGKTSIVYILTPDANQGGTPVKPDGNQGGTPVKPDGNQGGTPVKPDGNQGGTPVKPDGNQGGTPVKPDGNQGGTPVKPDGNQGGTPVKPDGNQGGTPVKPDGNQGGTPVKPDGNQGGTPVKPDGNQGGTPVANTGKITIRVNNIDGSTVVPTHVVANGDIGSEVNNIGYVPPKGYHITQITVNGKVVQSIEGIKIVPGTTSIIYTIAPNSTSTNGTDNSNSDSTQKTIIKALPDTGLGNAVSKGEEAAAIGGLLGVLGIASIFKRKK